MEAGQGPGGGEVGEPHENVAPKPYVPTEEERRLLKECADESARYRAFPLAAASMLATTFLIKKGILRETSRFGSFTKVAFAGTCGYLAGKISYLPICSEKFKKLKDSPIGDVLRQAQRHSSHSRSSRKSEFSDTPSQSFTEPSSPRAGFPLSSTYSDDYSSTDRGLSSYEPVPFSASLNESSPTGITDYAVQEPAPLPEEGRKKKTVTYEELRNKHRETYEVMVPPKAETPIKLPQEKPAKEVKVNKYGDTWDE
ncbi:OCIA domain-containing protein 1 [Mergus octosetaceus]|uniref:OCIA domain-containing protein 1 n=2 Tax=Anatidae TaxID=8830 RepID=A0A6J3CTK8_AYTFU|nr:OCIA domain-containing protein 1 [Anas platyrhynchos]XP_032042426.1 OCIA domain-containing protein 1 [Aythya fuligula]|eukprot:XP_027312923.1 OCIA domain-containing protein 1 [Anas platyrhynchos]